MDLLKRILNTINPPIILSMQPIDGGIRVRFQQHDQIIDPFSSWQVRELPKAVYQILEQAPKKTDGSLILFFKEASAVARILRSTPPESIELKIDTVLQLKIVPQPEDFAIHWELDSKLWRLRRRLIGAETSLGEGWFKQGSSVWPLHNLEAIPPALYPLLNKPVLGSIEAIPLLTELIPLAAQHGLPLTTDAEIAPASKLRLEIVKMLERSLDLRLVANPPAIMNTVQPMPNNPAHWVSGKFVFLNFGNIPNKIEDSLRTGQTVRVTGDDLPALIQDVLQPNAAQFGINVAALNAQYPLIELGALKPHWQLEHDFMRGVGFYRASLYFSKGQDSLQREAIRAKARNRAQYIRAKQGWIVLSSQIINRLHEIDARFGEDFLLDDTEVLGLPSIRLNTRDLSVPALETLAPTDDVNRVLVMVDNLRAAGLPAGIAGFGNNSLNILSGACQRLLSQYSAARILWVTPIARQNIIRLPLENNFRVRLANRMGDYSEAGTVYLCEDFHDGLNYGAWTAIVFENVDGILASADIGRWAGLTRDWTLFSASASMGAPNIFRRDRVYDLMRLIRLPPSAFDLFRQHCIQTAPESVQPEQPASTGGGFATTFRQIFIGDKGAKSEGLPIPRPPVVEDTKPSQPIREVFRPQFEAATSYSGVSSRESFVSQAKRWVNRTETQAEPVPFMQYTPTYADMTPDQQRWYFYWRTQGRSGNWLPTDLSYLLLYVYELVNLIGVGSPQVASDQLIQFWKNYRHLQPRLDSYLIDWIADLSAFFKLPLTPLAWVLQAMQEGVVARDTGLMFEAWRTQGKSIEAMPLSLFYLLADYTPTASKFYQQNNTDGGVDKAFLKSIAALDQYQRQKTGKGLFDLPASPQPREIRREPFSGVPNEYPKRALLIAQIQVEPKDQAALATQLQGAIKTTENILRERGGFKGKLRGVELPEGWAAVIERAQKIQPSRREVEFDISQIEKLKRESTEIRSLLTVEEDTPAIQNDAPEPGFPDSLPEADFLDKPVAPVRPADAPDGELTDLETIYQIIGSDPNAPSRVLISKLRESGWKAAPGTLQAALGSTFLSIVIDRINEKSQELLGDFLLFEEDGLWLFSDDFCDEAEYLLDHAYVPPAPAQPDYAMLDEHWAAFAQLLQPVHWRILDAMLSGADVNELLHRESLAAHTMPSILIETINDYALDKTEDLIIDTMVEPPVLMEEAVDSIRQLMAWAENQPALLR